jgi:hypothetical protein
MIQSNKLGIIGDHFEPTEGINIEALLEGGFIIVDESTETVKKSSTIKKTTKE